MFYYLFIYAICSTAVATSRTHDYCKYDKCDIVLFALKSVNMKMGTLWTYVAGGLVNHAVEESLQFHLDVHSFTKNSMLKITSCM